MTSETYTKAIEAAQSELDSVTEKIAALSQRQAQLQQSILYLRVLLGEEGEQEELRTDRIRTIIRASDKPVTAAQITRL